MMELRQTGFFNKASKANYQLFCYYITSIACYIFLFFFLLLRKPDYSCNQKRSTEQRDKWIKTDTCKALAREPAWQNFFGVR